MTPQEPSHEMPSRRYGHSGRAGMSSDVDADVKLLIVAAAIKQGRMICSVPRPGRHHDVIREMATAGISIPINGEQGFMTSDGVFVGRERARRIAFDADQIIASCVGSDGVPFKRNHPELFSEDVW